VNIATARFEFYFIFLNLLCNVTFVTRVVAKRTQIYSHNRCIQVILLFLEICDISIRLVFELFIGAKLNDR